MRELRLCQNVFKFLFVRSPVQKHNPMYNSNRTSYWDTDEFITFQQGKKKDREFGLYAEESTRKMEQPGYILRRLNTIKKEVNETGVSCVSVNRRRYCSKELNVSKINQMLGARSVIPEGLVMTGSSSHSNRSNLLSINAKHEDRSNTIRQLSSLIPRNFVGYMGIIHKQGVRGDIGVDNKGNGVLELELEQLVVLFVSASIYK